jgi:predicted RNase H-like nuclease (RuvC/YqgF family)
MTDMTKTICLGLTGLLLFLNVGCVTMVDQASLAQQQADYDRMQEDMQRLNEKLGGIQLEQQNLAREIEGLRKAPREDLVTKNRLDTLDRQVQALAAGREADRKQIVSDLSHKVAAIVGTSSSSGRGGGGAETGYEHVVESGQTLSTIAAAYKVSVSSIKKANNLKSDIVRVGQKLFIPKP